MAIKGSDFILSPEKAENEYMLVEVNDWTDYTTKEKLGFLYVVLFPKLQYEKVKVGVKGNLPVVTKEELAEKGQIPVVFEGLKTWASVYEKRLFLKAEARNVQRVQSK